MKRPPHSPAHAIGRDLGTAQRTASGRVAWVPGLQPDAAFFGALEQRLGHAPAEPERAAALEGWCACAVGFGYGQGSIVELESGRFRVRVPNGVGGRAPLPPFDSWSAANTQRLASLQLIANGTLVVTGATTLKAYGSKWLDHKSARKPRSAEMYRTRWESHIEGCFFASEAMGGITREDVATFITNLQRTRVRHGPHHTKPMSPAYVRGVFRVLKSILRKAQHDGLITANPCDNQELPEVLQKDRDAQDEEWLDLAEQEALLFHPDIPRPDVLLMGCALGSGLRAGEQTWMPRAHLEQAVRTGRMPVRFGSDGGPPKNGPRTVPLVELALAYMAQWLEQLDAYCPRNPRGLAFPMPDGRPRTKGHFLATHRKVDAWHLYRGRAGITKPVTWHGFRKSCASSLFSGLWDRQWTPQEVADYIGDTLEVVLAFYARLSRAKLLVAAQETRGGPLPQQVRERSGEVPARARRGLIRSETSDLTRGTSGIARPPVFSLGYADSDLFPDLFKRARALQRTVASGQPPADVDVADFLARAEALGRSLSPLLTGVDRVRDGGGFRLMRVLDLARLITEEAESKDAAQKKDGSL